MLRHALIAVFLSISAAPCLAADVTVQIEGISSGEGQIGCALFSQPKGFPGQSRAAATQVRKARPAGASCVFEDVKPGTYAVSVIHDRNGNGRLDTNLLGIPKEAWGVSNNARPALRAPRFTEAAFRVAAANRTVRVRVAPTLLK